MSELDQTIEELEAEVMAELDEKASLPGGKGLKAEPMKQDDDINDPLDNVNDTGKAHVDADQALPDEGDSKKAATLPGGKGLSAEKMKKLMDPNSSASSSNQGTGVTPPGQMPMQKMKEEDISREDLLNHLQSTMEHSLATMEEMDDEDLYDLVTSLDEGESAEYYDEDEMDEVVEMQIQNIDITADVEALMEGEDLSEEFKEKAAVIFEAAVKSKTREEVTRIMEEAQYAIAEEVDEFKQSLSEKVDQYLDYVVEEWMQENELAIERGLKGEIAEDFISGLKQLFEDHYIDVPEERYDILEAQSDRIAELEDHLNSIMESNIHMNSVNSELVREQVILEVSSDLADTEFEKFKSLTEDVDFNSEDSFRDKLDTLKESYFPKTNYLAEEAYEIDYENYGSAEQDIDTSDAMRAYSSAIGRVETRINGRS
tara:strand:- start:282 stop:1568 length:1287 start_codon:yes stop_codon:yes gene_type:complete